MKRITAVVVWLALSLAITPCAAEKKLGGIIRDDKRLTPEDGPYLLERDLLVSRTGRLTVMAGTRIIIGKPSYYDDSIPQIDGQDSQYVSIKVQGIVRFLGKRNNRITISSAGRGPNQCSWYGIVIDRTGEAFNEIAFTDIADACYGITVVNAKPVIRNAVIEYNNIGIRCESYGNARVSNCFIGRNLATGILVSGANPVITNTIIAHNRNNGIWCEDASKIDLRYNCVFGNGDGNLYQCDPVFGQLVKKNDNKDSVDAFQNLFCDPVFAGTPAELKARDRDISRKTDKSKVVDTTIAKMIQDDHGKGGIADTSGNKGGEPARTDVQRYFLSKYSPCRKAGDPAKQYRNVDGSRNDIGIFGGPDFLENKE
jgi:hypothetical protein